MQNIKTTAFLNPKTTTVPRLRFRSSRARNAALSTLKSSNSGRRGRKVVSGRGEVVLGRRQVVIGRGEVVLCGGQVVAELAGGLFPVLC